MSERAYTASELHDALQSLREIGKMDRSELASITVMTTGERKWLWVRLRDVFFEADTIEAALAMAESGARLPVVKPADAYAILGIERAA